MSEYMHITYTECNTQKILIYGRRRNGSSLDRVHQFGNGNLGKNRRRKTWNKCHKVQGKISQQVWRGGLL